MIYRKPELKPPDMPDMIFWNQSENLMNFIENNYHMPVDIYTHDSKPLYDLHADDVALIYYNGANTLYHQGRESPISKLLQTLHTIKHRLQNVSEEFVTEKSKLKFERLSFGVALKKEFWIWAQKLHLKMKMDFTEEFSPIVRDNRGRFYMNPTLANMTLETLDEDGIFQFFYDYIQGDITEYNKTEPLSESYIVGSNWKRRLEETTSGLELASKFNKVGKFILFKY